MLYRWSQYYHQDLKNPPLLLLYLAQPLRLLRLSFNFGHSQNQTKCEGKGRGKQDFIFRRQHERNCVGRNPEKRQRFEYDEREKAFPVNRPHNPANRDFFF